MANVAGERSLLEHGNFVLSTSIDKMILQKYAGTRLNYLFTD